jgi:hypothetical protein
MQVSALSTSHTMMAQPQSVSGAQGSEKSVSMIFIIDHICISVQIPCIHNFLLHGGREQDRQNVATY